MVTFFNSQVLFSLVKFYTQKSSGTRGKLRDLDFSSSIDLARALREGKKRLHLPCWGHLSDHSFTRGVWVFERFFLAEASPGLLLVDLNDVVLLHLQGLGGLVVVDTAAVEQEPENKKRKVSNA